jgi:phosphatidylserine/phosphatidylglycerophosphate/cardiolipin synthase-like enzyme
VSSALRAIHEAASRVGEPADVWATFVDRIGHLDKVDDDEIRLGLQAANVVVRPFEWRLSLVALGVLDETGAPDLAAAELVGDCLRLVGDDFGSSPAAWHLVATIPDRMRTGARKSTAPPTAGILLRLVDSARAEVRMATPYADLAAASFLVPSLLDAAQRGVSVHVVTGAGHAAVFQDAAAQWRGSATGGAEFMCYEAAPKDAPLGSHAKVVAVDRNRGYIGSANLTVAGLGRQLEVGVEVAGREVERVSALLEELEQVSQMVLVARR